MSKPVVRPWTDEWAKMIRKGHISDFAKVRDGLNGVHRQISEQVRWLCRNVVLNELMKTFPMSEGQVR